MQSICWLTDVHLNFVDKEQRLLLYQNVRQSKADAILLTGDIAEAPSIEKLLIEFSDHTGLPIYFVLGNHDYYSGSISEVRSAMTTLTSRNSQLFWLSDGQCVCLNEETLLIGHDTWADGRNGDFGNSQVRLNDSRLIADLVQAASVSHVELLKKMQQLADDDASALEISLQAALKQRPKKILIACHVPPFQEACWHINQPSNKDWVPYFSCKVLGDLLLKYAADFNDIYFEIYCGHTHTAYDYQATDNLLVRVGDSEYYHPAISDVLRV